MRIENLYYLDAEGLHAPEYQTILDLFLAEYRSIYGADSYLEPDGKDYEMIAVFALAQYDSMQTTVAVYNSFSPATGTGDGLTRNVAINGIRRLIPTYSTVDLTLTGSNGTTITNGYAKDALGRKWMLPASVLIAAGGTVTVPATAELIGTVETALGTITIIGTPTRGWFTVNNAAAAVAGQPVETDAALRIRQAISTMYPSQSLFEGVAAAVAAVDGVTKYKGYQNDTDTPGDVTVRSIAMIVLGGDSDEIAEAIRVKKSLGCGTDGTVSIELQDGEGYPITIKFYRPTDVDIEVAVGLDPLTGWAVSTEDAIAAAIKAHIDALPIGEAVMLSKIYSAANLPGTALGRTFNITGITICLALGTPGVLDLAIAFDELAQLALGAITITASA